MNAPDSNAASDGGPAPGLAASFAHVQDAFRTASRHPLSSRKTRLVAVLLDDFCDRLFEALRRDAPHRVFFAEDVLAFRERLRRDEPALGLVFDLCAALPAGPRLETHAVAIPIERYGELSVEDYMVSLYNANTVPRVMIVVGGETRLALDVLRDAMACLEGMSRRA